MAPIIAEIFRNGIANDSADFAPAPSTIALGHILVIAPVVIAWIEAGPAPI